MSKANSRIEKHFADLTDPRSGKVTYPLMDIIVIALCAVIGGADDFVAIADFANTKKEWLGRFLEMKNGVSSHDRFNAVLASIKPAEFEKCLLSWITSLHEITDDKIVAIDGETLRRSYDKASGKEAIHMVSAWATANQISLGQVVVDAKSNEITAVPKLLEMLEISGSLVTIDAMGCQTEIAKNILCRDADYCLAAKGNQPTLHAGIRDFLNAQLEGDFSGVKIRHHATNEKGHGRQEDRSYYICSLPSNLPDATRWPGLKAIGIAIHETVRDGKTSSEIRYYILSKYLSGRKFAEAVREYWSIENRLHWQLDVTFGEDQCRIRQGHADANFSILRRTALSMLKQETTAKVGVKNKRLKCGWDDAYLEKVLTGP